MNEGLEVYRATLKDIRLRTLKTNDDQALNEYQHVVGAV